jgi:2-keto-4-pentenoate hydratase/2-oxohepta-3-ene-1,7-dioic acid hydratase in catechol pathway
MYLLTFRDGSQEFLGIKTAHGIIDVAAAKQAYPMEDLVDQPDAFYAAGLAALPALRRLEERVLKAGGPASCLVVEANLQLGPCVPRPGKVICVGLNYRQHAKESNMEIPQTPVLFSKFQNAVAASGEGVPLPAIAHRYDYEAELAVVIGKRIRSVTESQALEAVLGYCNANDVSERELQGMTSQWLLGKTLDKFLPLGPYLLTADEAGDPQQWPVRCWLNGELRQDSNTADMIFSVAALVSFISQYMTLEPGDLISTGTPQGVILGRPKPRVWMKPGDVVTVEVGPLGKLFNPMIAEK